MKAWNVFAAAALSLLTALPVTAQEGLKVYISADMEGLVGTVTSDQLGPAGFDGDTIVEARRASSNNASGRS